MSTQPPSLEKVHITVTGLGYVGLPLALAFARRYPVIGYDVKTTRIAELQRGHDRNREADPSDLQASSANWTSDPAQLAQGNVHIVTVPTPVDNAKRPDFRPLLTASETIGQILQPGAVVVYESTVYPGATEEVCVPVLERVSGLRLNHDFLCGYSPERINPGDRIHTLTRICKVVAGSTPETTGFLAQLYGSIIESGTFPASSIRVAEAAKVIENTQRDLNIALMNELSLIFHRLGIDTLEVLEAAGTKWNFLPFRPGLVGGHCIGVDPYYLTHKAQELGYQPEVILAGRRINDSMALYAAQECIRLLIQHDRPVKGARIAVLGATFKENCPDTRNSKVFDLVRELQRYGTEVLLADPFAQDSSIPLVPIQSIHQVDAIIAAVAHDEFRTLTPATLAKWLGGRSGPVLDLKGLWDPAALRAAGLEVWRF